MIQHKTKRKIKLSYARVLIGDAGGGIFLFFSASSSCTCTSNSRFNRSARFSRGKGGPLAVDPVFELNIVAAAVCPIVPAHTYYCSLQLVVAIEN